jgi:ATP/maltotriose-dependent transcriptional regulator MalT
VDDELSSREIKVLKLIAAGNSNRQIVNVAESTIKSRVTNILSKLYPSDRAHAVTIGLKSSVIEL